MVARLDLAGNKVLFHAGKHVLVGSLLHSLLVDFIVGVTQGVLQLLEPVLYLKHGAFCTRFLEL